MCCSVEDLTQQTSACQKIMKQLQHNLHADQNVLSCLFNQVFDDVSPAICQFFCVKSHLRLVFHLMTLCMPPVAAGRYAISVAKQKISSNFAIRSCDSVSWTAVL